MNKIIFVILLFIPIYSMDIPKSDDLFIRIFYYIGTFCSEDKNSPIIIESYFLNHNNFNYSKTSVSNFNSSLNLLWVGLNCALSDISNKNLTKTAVMPPRFLPHYSRMNHNDLLALNQLYINFFSHKLFIKFIKIKNNNSFSPYIIFYNKNALINLFDKLYRPPNVIISGYNTKTIYNLLFKSMVHENINNLIKILKSPEILNDQSDQYYKEITNNPLFNCEDFLIGCNIQLEISPVLNKDLIGMVIRRNLDGTLPYILQKLLIVLHDYDIEYYNKICKLIITYPPYKRKFQ